MEIKGFSPEAAKAVRDFYLSHPVFEMEQLREIAVEGPGGELVECLNAVCLRCGFEMTPADNPMLEQGKVWPADTFKAVILRHAWDQQGRDTYCGGVMRFETRPALMLTVIN